MDNYTFRTESVPGLWITPTSYPQEKYTNFGITPGGSRLIHIIHRTLYLLVRARGKLVRGVYACEQKGGKPLRNGLRHFQTGKMNKNIALNGVSFPTI